MELDKEFLDHFERTSAHNKIIRLKKQLERKYASDVREAIRHYITHLEKKYK